MAKLGTQEFFCGMLYVASDLSLRTSMKDAGFFKIHFVAHYILHNAYISLFLVNKE